MEGIERLKKLSNPISTGGGGYNFERHVQATFLIALLINGFSPVVDGQIEELQFQALQVGYHTDDLAVTASIYGNRRKLLCQIKNDITVSEKNAIFQEVITAAWYDFAAESFNPSNDRIALITNTMAKASIISLREIHNQAMAARDEKDFLRRIDLANFTSKAASEKLTVFRKCLKKAKGEEISDRELFFFCKSFLLVIFDGNYTGSIHEALCKSLIQCKSNKDPLLVWHTLCDYAGRYNQSAACITRENVDQELKEIFALANESSATDFSPVSVSVIPSENWARLAIIGAWSENCEADKQAIEKITGINYSLFRAFARDQFQKDRDSIELKNGTWKVKNRESTLLFTADYIDDDLVKNAFAVAETVLSEQSKQFSDGAYGFITPDGGWFSNSATFRKALCEGLCLLANTECPQCCSEHLIEKKAFQLVKNLISSDSWETLAGLGELLPLLAELSPKAFLQELETFAAERPDEFKNLILPNNRNELLAPNYFSYIRWSLTRLAWVPSYCVGCIRCFGIIEKYGKSAPDQEYITRDSMVSILNAFQPQTYASIQQKKNAITALQKDDPELCWSVIEGLIPSSSFVLMDAQKPKYLDVSRDKREIDSSEREEMLQHYTETAIQMAADSSKRTAELLDHIDYMDITLASECLKQIKTSILTWTDEMKYQVWRKLRRIRVQCVLRNKRKEPQTTAFQLLNQTIDAAKPQSRFYQYLYLFEKDGGDYLIEDWESRRKKRETERKDAAFDLFQSGGMECILAFAKRANDIYGVGTRLGERLSIEQTKDVLRCFSTDQDSRFYPAVIGGFFRKNGIDKLEQLGINQYDDYFRSKVLLAAPLEPELLPMIDVYLQDKSLYWKSVSISWIPSDWPKQVVDQIIHELSENGRYIAIVNAIDLCWESIDLPDKMITSILLGAAEEQSNEKLDSYSACEMIKKLQSAANLDIVMLSKIEFAFLPLLEYHALQPRAIYYRLANEPALFCQLMEMTYKPCHEERKTSNHSEELSKRLYYLTQPYCVVPGTDWVGNFDSAKFCTWIDEAFQWSIETDRREVVQETIGNGLSYAPRDNGLPNETILNVLNQPTNRELRYGFQLGTVNQRGFHTVDPTGREELELAEEYKSYAKNAEDRGYSRVAEMLLAIEEWYQFEAEDNKRMHEHLELEEEASTEC